MVYRNKQLVTRHLANDVYIKFDYVAYDVIEKKVKYFSAFL